VDSRPQLVGEPVRRLVLSGLQRALLLALTIGAFALPCGASEEESGSYGSSASVGRA